MKKILMIAIIYLFALALIGCGNDSIQETETKENKINYSFTTCKVKNGELDIIGYGIGINRSKLLARKIAVSGAKANLLHQVKGANFVYAGTDKYNVFATKAKGVLKPDTISIVRLASKNRQHIFFCKAKTKTKIQTPNNAEVLHIDISTRFNIYSSKRDNVVRHLLYDLKKEAVILTAVKKYPDKKRFSGKIYITRLIISKPDENGNGRISVQFAIIHR